MNRATNRLVLLTFLLAGWPPIASGSEPDAFRYLPDQPRMYHRFRLDAIFKSAAYTEFRKQRLALCQWLERDFFVKENGVRLPDVATVEGGGGFAGSRDRGCNIFHLQGAVTPADIEKRIRWHFPELKTQRVGRQTVYRHEKDASYAIPSPKVLVLTDDETLVSIFARDGIAPGAKRLKSLLGKADATKAILLLADLSAMSDEERRNFRRNIGIPAVLELPDLVETVVAGFDVGTQISGSVAVTCRDAAGAVRTAAVVKQLMEAARDATGSPGLKRLFDAVHTKAEGRTVALTARWTVEDLLAAAPEK